nr:MAG TPA: hypothetical protein [Bacteriophage sp.]
MLVVVGYIIQVILKKNGLHTLLLMYQILHF